MTLCSSSGGYLLHASNVWLLTKDDVSLVYGALPKNHHHHEPPQLLVGHHNSQMSYPIFQMSNHICQWATTTANEPPYIPNISIQNWATASSTFSRKHDIVEVIWNPGSQFQFYYCWQRSYCREGKVLEIRILVYTVLVFIDFYIISSILSWPSQMAEFSLHFFS